MVRPFKMPQLKRFNFDLIRESNKTISKTENYKNPNCTQLLFKKTV